MPNGPSRPAGPACHRAACTPFSSWRAGRAGPVRHSRHHGHRGSKLAGTQRPSLARLGGSRLRSSRAVSVHRVEDFSVGGSFLHDASPFRGTLRGISTTRRSCSLVSLCLVRGRRWWAGREAEMTAGTGRRPAGPFRTHGAHCGTVMDPAAAAGADYRPGITTVTSRPEE